jgi:hypothetical protein
MNTRLLPRLLAALLLLLLAGCTLTPPTPPRVFDIIEADAWGGQAASDAERARARPHIPTRLTLHHGGVAFGRDKDPVAHLINLQRWSRKMRGWADIPYHYVIDLDGRVYAARDVMLAGDTNTQYDPAGHALVMVLGNFEEAEPTPAQIEAAAQTFAYIAKRFGIPIKTLASHKDYAETACPGRNLYRYLADGTIARRAEEILRP